MDLLQEGNKKSKNDQGWTLIHNVIFVTGGDTLKSLFLDQMSGSVTAVTVVEAPGEEATRSRGCFSLERVLTLWSRLITSSWLSSSSLFTSDFDLAEEGDFSVTRRLFFKSPMTDVKIAKNHANERQGSLPPPKGAMWDDVRRRPSTRDDKKNSTAKKNGGGAKSPTLKSPTPESPIPLKDPCTSEEASLSGRWRAPSC